MWKVTVGGDLKRADLGKMKTRSGVMHWNATAGISSLLGLLGIAKIWERQQRKSYRDPKHVHSGRIGQGTHSQGPLGLLTEATKSKADATLCSTVIWLGGLQILSSSCRRLPFSLKNEETRVQMKSIFSKNSHYSKDARHWKTVQFTTELTSYFLDFPWQGQFRISYNSTWIINELHLLN